MLHLFTPTFSQVRLAKRATLLVLGSVSVLLATPQNVSAQRGRDAVTVRAVAAKSTLRPGDQIVIAVIYQHQPNYHSWPNEPVVPPELGSFTPIPTTLDLVSVPEGAEVLPIQWPTPVPVEVNYTGTPLELLSYVEQSIAYASIDLSPDQTIGAALVELSAGYQACDDRLCYPPQTVNLSIPLQVISADVEATIELNEPELFAGFGLSGNRASSGMLRPVSMNVFGWSFSFNPRGPTGMALLLLVAAIGGLVLNFTPCVLPVIPIKILGLSRASDDPSRLLLLGLVMSLGVVAFWIGLGGAIAFVSGFSATSSLFQNSWFAPMVGLVVAIMAAGMMGLFNFRLPQFVYKLNPGEESLPGSFAFGILTAVLSTPCTAPFMAGASAWAATQAPATTLSTFGAIGVGMAVPYLLLSARPGLVKKVPKTGPASVLVKQVMGLLMLAVAAFFLGTSIAAWLQQAPDPPSRLYWWLVCGFIVIACGWTVYRTFAITESTAKRSAVGLISLGIALVCVSLATSFSSHGPIDWTYYTEQRLEQAAREGDVVVLDFTAEWCLNCKALEHGVLHQEEIVELLNGPGVIPMRIDLTGDNPPGKAKLSELEWVGIPLLAIYGPGTGYANPIKFDSYTARMVLDAVQRVRGIRAPG
ncbi:cytochrome c biogenesis protein CcdA [Gemmatimonadota bacterium]